MQDVDHRMELWGFSSPEAKHEINYLWPLNHSLKIRRYHWTWVRAILAVFPKTEKISNNS